jgi:hypothetical protein
LTLFKRSGPWQGPEETNAIKRVAPSVGMKEEVDGILWGTVVGAVDPI